MPSPPRTRGRLATLAVLLVVGGGAVVWASCSHHFPARLVACEFVPAARSASAPGGALYPGEDALLVRFQTERNLVALAETRQLQFRCRVLRDGADDELLFGAIFADLDDPAWAAEIGTRAARPLRYVARVRLDAAEAPPWRDRLRADGYRELRCQVVGVTKAPGLHYSSELCVPRGEVRRAVAEGLGR